MKKKKVIGIVLTVAAVCFLTVLLVYCFSLHEKERGSQEIEGSYYGGMHITDGAEYTDEIEVKEEDAAGFLSLDIQVSSGSYSLKLLDENGQVQYETEVQEGGWLQEKVALGKQLSARYRLIGTVHTGADADPVLSVHVAFLSEIYGYRLLWDRMCTKGKEIVDALGVSNYKKR